MKTENILAAAAGLAVGYMAFREKDAAVGYVSNKKWYAKDGQIADERTGKTIAVIPHYDGDFQQQQDADLMASAPKLLKALEFMVDRAEQEKWHKGSGDLKNIHRQASDLVYSLNVY